MGVKRLAVSIGIDLGGTNIKFGLVTADGKILSRLNIPTSAEEGPKSVVSRIIKTIRHLASSLSSSGEFVGTDSSVPARLKSCLQFSSQPHRVNKVKVKSIGIGSAGLVNHRQGIIHFSPNLPGWKNIPLKKWIEDEVKAKVFVGNDANAFALGEYCFGAGIGSSSLFGITLGTGIGGGIIFSGKLLLGINQVAGEVGHTSINAFGPKCRCGNYGCLERYAGAEYIVERAIKQLKSQTGKRKPQNSTMLKLSKYNYSNITPEIISLAAKKEDRLAKAIIKETGFYVGVGVANVVSLIDPEIIVIGGGVSGFGKLLLDSIKKTVSERIMNFSGRKLKIVLSKLKDDAAILGASQFEKFL